MSQAILLPMVRLSTLLPLIPFALAVISDQGNQITDQENTEALPVTEEATLQTLPLENPRTPPRVNNIRLTFTEAGIPTAPVLRRRTIHPTYTVGPDEEDDEVDDLDFTGAQGSPQITRVSRKVR